MPESVLRSFASVFNGIISTGRKNSQDWCRAEYEDVLELGAECGRDARFVQQLHN